MVLACSSGNRWNWDLLVHEQELTDGNVLIITTNRTLTKYVTRQHEMAETLNRKVLSGRCVVSIDENHCDAMADERGLGANSDTVQIRSLVHKHLVLKATLSDIVSWLDRDGWIGGPFSRIFEAESTLNNGDNFEMRKFVVFNQCGSEFVRLIPVDSADQVLQCCTNDLLVAAIECLSDSAQRAMTNSKNTLDA